jgi:hypothetical protein
MESQVVAVPVARWYERGWVRITSVVVIAVGVVLLGVGVAGFVSASSTNDDVDATRAELAAVQGEADSLRRQSETILAEAEAARTKAAEAGADVTLVTAAVGNVADRTNTSIDRGNEIVACSSATSDAAFVSCTTDELAGFQEALTQQVASIESLRTLITDLERSLS